MALTARPVGAEKEMPLPWGRMEREPEPKVDKSPRSEKTGARAARQTYV